MVRLTSTNGSFVALTIVHYQFESGLDWYDSNWLVLSGEASDLAGRWSFRDPCLLTTEAQTLGGWLRRAADASLSVDRIDFLEPNLSFERVTTNSKTSTIRVGFDLESRPAGAAEDEVYCVDLCISTEACVEASDDWLRELEHFPERN